MIRAAHPIGSDKVVEAELAKLSTTPIANLRMRYRELFRTNSPKAFGPDLLRRSIAQRIQERAYGGLSKDSGRVLRQLVKAARSKSTGKLELPRRIKAGSELVRTWRGATYRVKVTTEGFSFEGETYASLSEIACKITGTRWNGPRFFGLRSSTAPSGSGDASNGN
jgi:hypothetical protein